ncbi:hypothetical protein AAG906_015528 [Vitis piasezkii]
MKPKDRRMLAGTRASSHLLCSGHMRIQTSLKSQDPNPQSFLLVNIGKTALATIVSIKVADHEGFERCHSEHTLFVKTSKGGKILILSLYVDDLIFIGNDESMFYEFKSSMMHEFDMTDLGKMRFGMEESNYVHSPIVTGFKVFKDENGVKVDATFFKHIVGSTTNLGIFYKKGRNDKLVSFIDSDYVGDLEDRKSTSGIPLESSLLFLSTIEAEFIATTSCACQVVWMRRILEKLSYTQGVVELVHCGTQDQIADVMTKPLKLDMFLKLRELMGVREVLDVN